MVFLRYMVSVAHPVPLFLSKEPSVPPDIRLY